MLYSSVQKVWYSCLPIQFHSVHNCFMLDHSNIVDIPFPLSFYLKEDTTLVIKENISSHILQSYEK